MRKFVEICALSVIMAVLGNGCSATELNATDSVKTRLDSCPDRPNCVSSEARDAKRTVPPLRLKPLPANEDSAKSWRAIQGIVSKMPRTTIVQATDRYLHAECRSRLGFVDDLELLLDPASGVVAIRSAARMGYSDLGVNRRRVSALRRELEENGLIQ